MTKNLPRLLAALFALCLLASACGEGSGAVAAEADPNEAVRAAFTALDLDATEVTISLDVSGDELLAAIGSEGPEDGVRAAADLLANARIHIAGAGEDMAVAISIGSTDLLELRLVDSVAYLRVDLRAAVGLGEQIEPGGGAELEDVIAAIPLMAAADQRLGFLTDLVDGGWVSFDASDRFDSDGFWHGAARPQSNDALAATLSSIIDDNTVVTAAGQARGGDRYLVEVDFVDLVEALAADPLTAEAFQMADVDTDELLAEMAADGVAPTWELDVVLVDGQLSSMRVDIASLSTEALPGSTLPILITFGSSSSGPSAPPSHTPIPAELLDELVNEMLGGMMGGATL